MDLAKEWELILVVFRVKIMIENKGFVETIFQLSGEFFQLKKKFSFCVLKDAWKMALKFLTKKGTTRDFIMLYVLCFGG